MGMMAEITIKKDDWKSMFPQYNIFYQDAYGMLYNGHVLEILKQFPDESIDCVITSPPYWALRDYGIETIAIWGGSDNCEHEFVCPEDSYDVSYKEHNNSGHNCICVKCGAWKGQLGLEPDFSMYINHLILVFNEIYRILKPVGTLWVNISDTYAKSAPMNSFGGRISKNGKTKGMYKPKNKAKTVKAKSLIQIPSRFAIAMIDSGWILRNEIIWHKPNASPQNVKDRFTIDFEKIFFFTKQQKYYFKQIKEDNKDKYEGRRGKTIRRHKLQSSMRSTGTMDYWGKGRNKRTVWSINAKPFKDAHFAVFPTEIPLTCIEAGCPPNGIVLDPFMGSGTTAIAAITLNRKWIGIEVSDKYCEIAKKRLSQHRRLPLSYY